MKAEATRNDVIRSVIKRALRRFAWFTVMALSVWGAAMGLAFAGHYTAFGQEITLPRNTPPGVVLARHYFTPYQVCQRDTCTVTNVINYPNGGFKPEPGPVIDTNVSGVSARMLIDGASYTSGNNTYSIPFTRNIEIQLISDGRPNLGGTLVGTYPTSTQYFIVETKANGTTGFHLSGTITPIDGTCSVPSKTVSLQPVSTRKFGDVGSTAGTQSFQVQVNNCPKGFNRVGYALFPVGGEVANAPGVLPLSSDSTASGVRIRIEDSTGTPVTFKQSKDVPGYSKAAGGSYSIPMLASYIKTEAKVDGGTVGGAMTVLMDYQ